MSRTPELRCFYELGQAAGQRGEPLDACRYRRADRRNAWVRGWHAGNDLRLRLEAFRAAVRSGSALVCRDKREGAGR